MKPLRSIFILWLLFGLSTGTARADGGDGVVEGRLVNGTAGGSGVAGQTVTLKVYGETEQIDERTAETDADGAFRYNALKTGSGFFYQVLVAFAPDVDQHPATIDI